MKHLLLLFSLLFSLLHFKASAQDISGLYSGTMVNDSTKKVQNYELTLSEYRGNITGYAYTTFVVNDTFYYSVKRVKATKAGGELIVEDVKMLANNFPEAPSKGVRQVNTIPLNQHQDSITELIGSWRTTQTKVYYSLHGSLDLKKDNDSLRSPLMSHLYELDILERPALVYAEGVRVSEKDKTKKPGENKQAAVESKVKTTEIIPADKRAVKVLQTIDVVTDSLVFTFYDNGIVDGDTISVAFDGQNIIEKARLTAVAAKRTVVLRPGSDETYQLILIAENLGSIPPNTGLLVVQDGPNRHAVHFTADLQNNAAVVFRKR